MIAQDGKSRTETPRFENVVDHVIRIPRTHDMLTPILASVPLQLLAYHIAVLARATWTSRATSRTA